MEFQNHDTAGDFFFWWIESNHEKEVKTHKEQKRQIAIDFCEWNETGFDMQLVGPRIIRPKDQQLRRKMA